MEYCIGTSGWHYEHWRGRFYPSDLPRSQWLEFYARYFSTVELNNSFYRLPSENAFTSWFKSTPPHFTFAVKVSRFITHIKRLTDTGEAANRFINSARILSTKLGPLLYQLPPDVPRNDTRLEAFLAALPQEVKHVFEFRNKSWLDEGIFDILRRHHAGFCIFDMPGTRTPLVATADFAYIRFHGSASLYSSYYSDEELAGWAKQIAELSRNLKTIYIYFNNDTQAFAVENAMKLRSFLQA